MERAEGPQTPYEVYCHACRVTFPVGTRRCVHCGGPVGGHARAAGLLALQPAHAEEEAPQEFSIARRIGGISLWVLIAIAAAVSRICAE